MAHITSIGAGMFSDLSVSTDTVPTTLNQTNLDALFALTDFTTTPTAFRIANVREFPAMGTPPNVVNVPVYGAATSQQIQGQADAPSMEITLNFIASDWASGTDLGALVGDGSQHVFRFALLNAIPSGAEAYASSATGLGDVQNSYWYWVGKLEAMQVTPQLTDANTCTITITIQSAFYGAYTT
jgi:hypothetical protein